MRRIGGARAEIHQRGFGSQLLSLVRFWPFRFGYECDLRKPRLGPFAEQGKDFDQVEDTVGRALSAWEQIGSR